MKILNTSPFVSPINVQPGDTLNVIWYDSDKQIATLQVKIKHQQILSTAVLVEYTTDEAQKLGFKEALGMFAGEKYEDPSE